MGMIEDMERSYLSTLMLWPELIPDFRIDPKIMSTDVHKDFLQTILELYDNDEDPNQWTVPIAAAKKSRKVSHDYALSVCIHAGFEPGRTLRPLVDELERMAIVRDVQSAALAAANVSDDLDPMEVANSYQGLAERLQSLSQTSSVEHAGSTARRGLHELVNSAMSQARVITGVRAVDDIVGFIGAGDCMIVGADTGVGKSSFMLHMAMANCQKFDGDEFGEFVGRDSDDPPVKVGMISCEDSAGTLGARILAHRMNCNPVAIRRQGALALPEMDVVDGALKWAEDLGLYCAFEIGSNEDQINATMSRMVREHGVQCIMVDYVQTVIPAKRSQSRREDIRTISAKLKGNAHRLGVPIVLASQLSRPPQDQKSKKREFSKHALKESGDLENMAEAIVLLRVGDDPMTIEGKLVKNKWGALTEFAMRRNSRGVLQDAT